jgi:argininosuccinate lyase
MSKAKELLTLIKNKDTKTIIERMDQLKKKLKETDSDFADSYETMYKMLESTEK